MKKILMTAVFIATLSGASYGISPEAKKIVDTYEGASGPCRVPGTYERGTLYPSGKHETQTSNNSVSNNVNSNYTNGNSQNANVGLTSLGAGISANESNSQGRSATNTQDNGAGTTYDYICVPNSQRY